MALSDLYLASKGSPSFFQVAINQTLQDTSGNAHLDVQKEQRLLLFVHKVLSSSEVKQHIMAEDSATHHGYRSAVSIKMEYHSWSFPILQHFMLNC